jgi:hypothetical protein
MTRYRDSFTFLCVEDVRAIQETPMGLHGLIWILGKIHEPNTFHNITALQKQAHFAVLWIVACLQHMM